MRTLPTALMACGLLLRGSQTDPRRLVVLLGLVAWLATGHAAAQQQADTLFQPGVANPAYAPGAGPVVLVDEAHHNFHTAEGRYQAFATVLRADGYVVRPSTRRFDADALDGADVLVISNPLHTRNVEAWQLPTPSAFTPEEIEHVRAWVERGGALLLIADHMPFPGAAEAMGAAFGFQFNNGFALDTLQVPATMFHRADGLLRDHPITNGRTAAERVDSVRSFTGQAFRAGSEAQPLLVMGPTMVSLMPETAWDFDETTRRVPVAGWLQGAVLRFGEGRVAVFGEAAMFTAQYVPQDNAWFGMKSPGAEQNQQFLLNVLHWLSGIDTGE